MFSGSVAELVTHSRGNLLMLDKAVEEQAVSDWKQAEAQRLAFSGKKKGRMPPARLGLLQVRVLPEPLNEATAFSVRAQSGHGRQVGGSRRLGKR